MTSQLRKLAQDFQTLGKVFRSERRGQFVYWEPHIVNEKLCKGLAELCLDLERYVDLTRPQLSKLRTLRLLIKSSLFER